MRQGSTVSLAAVGGRWGPLGCLLWLLKVVAEGPPPRAEMVCPFLFLSSGWKSWPRGDLQNRSCFIWSSVSHSFLLFHQKIKPVFYSEGLPTRLLQTVHALLSVGGLYFEKGEGCPDPAH